ASELGHRGLLGPSGLGGAIDAEGGQQVFVQLEPDRVVRVDERLGEPTAVAVEDLVARGGETALVPPEPAEVGVEVAADGAGPAVQADETADDALVVVVVGVVVERVATDLPVGADGAQLGV